MQRPVPALMLAAAIALGAGPALAQQPPPGGGPPAGAMRPPPPDQAGLRPPPPPPPPRPPPPPPPNQDSMSQASAMQPVPTAGVPAPAATTPPAQEPPLPTAVQPFPQLEQQATQAQEAAPPTSTAAASAGRFAAAKAPARELGAAASGDAVAAPLPRWLWLLAGACLLLFAGWRAALRKSRVLGDEAERLARNQRQLQSAHVKLQTHSEHLRELATIDPLTGVLNRQGFASELRRVLEHLARFRRPLNLLLFDMDNFKQINDRLGHLVGDQALKLVVGVVREHLASEDLFGRFGGDEFMIACADQPLAETQALAESIRAGVVRGAANHQPSLVGLSLSIGIAQANESQGYLADALFQRADTALYAAKNSGRNRVVLADDSLAPPPAVAAATRHLA